MLHQIQLKSNLRLESKALKLLEGKQSKHRHEQEPRRGFEQQRKSPSELTNSVNEIKFIHSQGNYQQSEETDYRITVNFN